MTSLAELGISPSSLEDFVDRDRSGKDTVLGSMFALWSTLAQHGNPPLLEAFQSVLSRELMIAYEWRGLDELMLDAQLKGWVENGCDILPLIEPLLRQKLEGLARHTPEKIASIPIIGVVGKIASGKGTVAQLLAQKYDVAGYPFSDRLRDLAQAMGYHPPFTREQLRSVNDIYKPLFGKQLFVEWTLEIARREATSLHTPQVIVVDGFRSREEALHFLSQPNTHLVAVVADDDPESDRLLRFKRQQERKRGTEDSLTWEGFMKDDAVESGWIEPVIELARERGRIIYNNGSLGELEQSILNGLSDILPELTE